MQNLIFVVAVVEMQWISLEVERVGCVDAARVARIELPLSDVCAAIDIASKKDYKALWRCF